MKSVFSHTKNMFSTMVLPFSLEEKQFPPTKNNYKYIHHHLKVLRWIKQLLFIQIVLLFNISLYLWHKYEIYRKISPYSVVCGKTWSLYCDWDSEYIMYTWQLNHILFPSTEGLLSRWNEKGGLGMKYEFMWRLKSRGRYLEGFRKVFKWPLRRNFSHKESPDCRVEIECCYPQHRL